MPYPDKKVPRYSDKAFPPYRFIPRETPHPTEHPEGHSYKKKESPVEILTETNWSRHPTYLYAVDLYNYGYWWEAHENFEQLWRLYPKNDLTRNFFQGLIKISAAFLKWQQKQNRGTAIHYRGAMDLLQKVKSEKSFYLGINLAEYLLKLEHCFQKMTDDPLVWPDSLAQYPFITLNPLS